MLCGVPNDLRAKDAPFDGRWWSDDDQSHVVGGRLDLEGGYWVLTMFGWLGPWDRGRDAHHVPAVIHGQIGPTPVTLLDLVPRGWRASGTDPPYERRLAVNTAIAGLHTIAGAKFDSAAVRLLHLNEWANRGPWTFPSTTAPSSQHVVVFTDPGELTADLPAAKARLWRGWDQSAGEGNLSSLTLASDECVQFDFHTPLDLAAIDHDYVRPLRNLVELAAAARSPTLELAVTPDGADTTLAPTGTVLSAAPLRDVPQPKPWLWFLFTLGDVDFSTMVSRWWRLHSEIGVVPDLVAELSDPGYVGNQFLNAASAIEGYHRHRQKKQKASPEHKARVKRIVDAAPVKDHTWLMTQLAFSHQPDFAERVEEVAALAGPPFAKAVGDPERWRTWIKQGRNSVAHRDPSMVDLERDWRTTVRVTATIRWLMMLVFLRDLGIPDSDRCRQTIDNHEGTRLGRAQRDAGQ